MRLKKSMVLSCSKKCILLGVNQMSEVIKVALLYGGKSGEHEVSLVSAAAVLKNLHPDKYVVTPIAIDKNGLIYKNLASELRQNTEALPVKTATSIPVSSLINNGRFCCDVDVVFSIIHGRAYEDGCLQGILRHAEVAFVGADVLGSAIGMSKDVAKKLAVQDDLKTARFILLDKTMSQSEISAWLDTAATELSWPMFVKPSCAGSSVGISKVHDFAGLEAAINEAWRFDDEILLEEAIVGREIEVAVLENHRKHTIAASLPGEIKVKHKDNFYSYAAKYLESDASEYLIPAPLELAWQEKIQQEAIAIFKRLKCRGMARVDFFFDDVNEELYFNEVNTIPGFTEISFYPLLWSKSGLETPELLDCLIDTAILQQQERSLLTTDFRKN